MKIPLAGGGGGVNGTGGVGYGARGTGIAATYRPSLSLPISHKLYFLKDTKKQFSPIFTIPVHKIKEHQKEQTLWTCTIDSKN